MWPRRHNHDVINASNPFSKKNLVNTNPHAQFSAFMTFGLEVSSRRVFALPPITRVKCVGQIASAI